MVSASRLNRWVAPSPSPSSPSSILHLHHRHRHRRRYSHRHLEESVFTTINTVMIITMLPESHLADRNRMGQENRKPYVLKYFMQCSDVTNKRIARKIFLPFTLKHLKHVLIGLARHCKVLFFREIERVLCSFSLETQHTCNFCHFWCQNIQINHSNHFHCSPCRDGSDERECTEVVLPGRCCPCPCHQFLLSLSLVARLASERS